MIIKNKIVLSCMLLLSSYASAQIQCAVDVTINEGATITMCESSPTTISGLNGFVSYAWTGPETVTGQTITPQFSGQYVLAALDAASCVSTDTIDVLILVDPIPIILSSEGNNICSTGGTILSTSTPYASYDWGTGNNGATFFIDIPSTYNVTVVDADGCEGSNSISINAFNFELSSSPVSACSNSGFKLLASGGTSYAWSTGVFGNTINVNPSATTNYSVTITAGSCSETLQISVEPIDIIDFYLPDTVFTGVDESILISGPDGFSSYNWGPISNISTHTNQSVTFTGSAPQLLNLEAIHSSGCIITDSVLVLVLDLSIPNGFSPNGDDFNQAFVIPELELYNLDASFVIWNRWGEMVLEEDHYQNDWEGKCETNFCLGNDDLPDGTYFYLLEVKSINFKGYITLKR